MTNRWKKSHTNKGGVYMATSSITKNFIISGKEQVEMFVNAIEESAKNRPVHTSVAAREIKGEAELRNMMKLRNMKIKEKENAGK
jgi:hypothetical protein